MIIEFREWDHTCGDGCCYLYGTEIYIDGIKIEHYENTKEEPVDNSYIGDNPKTAVLSVLKHLGIQYEE